MMAKKRQTAAIDPVLFWAELDPAALWRGAAMVALFMAPLAFLAPAAFIAAGFVSLALSVANRRSFRFHLSRRELRLKLSFLMPELRLPLSEIGSVSVLPDSAGGFLPLAPRSGHLLIARTDGAQVLVPSVKDAVGVAQAIDRLRRREEPGEAEREAA